MKASLFIIEEDTDLVPFGKGAVGLLPADPRSRGNGDTSIPVLYSRLVSTVKPLRPMSFLLVMLSLVGCEDPHTLCTAGELVLALDNAYRGDAVHIGSCRIEGSFTIPDGVNLEGLGESSVLVGDGEHPVIVLEADSRETSLKHLGIESAGPFGIYSQGQGTVHLEGVTVTATKGVGIGLEGLGRAVLVDVSTSGPVTSDNAESFPSQPSREETAILGIFIVRVEEAELSRVSSNGFAGFGVILADGDTSWRQGNASTNLGCGLAVQGGRALLEDLVLCDTYRGMNLIPAYGGYFRDAEVETHNVEVCESEGVGLMHELGTAIHSQLQAHDNDESGMWIQKARSFELGGSDSRIMRNSLAGLVFIDVSGAIDISEARIETTEKVRRFYAGAQTVWSGDGIQIVRPEDRVRLTNLEVSMNERVGLLLEEPSQSTTLTIDDVLVDGVEDQLGAIAQGTFIPDQWDLGVTRRGQTVVNDAENEETLEVILSLEDSDLPPSSQLVELGLEGLLPPG